MILEFSIDHIKLRSATRVRGSSAKDQKQFFNTTEYKYYKDLLGGLITLKIPYGLKNLQNVYFVFRYRNVSKKQDLDNIEKAVLDTFVQNGLIVRDDRSAIVKGIFHEAIEAPVTGLDVWVVADEKTPYKTLSDIIGGFEK